MTIFVDGAKLTEVMGPLAWGGSFLLGYVWGPAFGGAPFVAPPRWPAQICLLVKVGPCPLVASILRWWSLLLLLCHVQQFFLP